MRLLLINPRNALVNVTDKKNYWNKYRVWKPLGLLVLAGLTPPEWEITVVDENLDTPDYTRMPRPDLVGLTAFTSQAPRAYELASGFRGRGVPVVMGGIHATMRQDEAASRVDAVVSGEAEGVWAQVLQDVTNGVLKPLYAGGAEDIENMPSARQDLLPTGYFFGAIQTTRGCPLNCSFCSVSAFNGRSYRRRSVEDVVAEFRQVREKHVLIVDDNLIGTRRDHIARSKELFRALIDAKLDKKWICQATINMADDEELLRLARKSGCVGVFIGFESTSDEGLVEVHKKYNMKNDRDFSESVRRIQKHRIAVAGSFIMGLDVDRAGIGRHIAETAQQYGVDFLNMLFLTPLPGTDLWNRMEADGRIAADRFPEDWKYYTLTLPVGRYKHLGRKEIIEEMNTCIEKFYSPRNILRRAWRNLYRMQRPFLVLAGNLSYYHNGRSSRTRCQDFTHLLDRLRPALPLPPTGENLHVLAKSLNVNESSRQILDATGTPGSSSR